MKKSWFPPLVFGTLFLCLHSGAQAQFFKDILNSVKQTAQGRANSKADQTTNKALDKVDSGTQLKGTHSSGESTHATDTAATTKLLNSFAQAAAANPNDTSSADLTMKALGIFTSGPTISKQDSLAAISSYKTASGGSGLHYMYLMVMRDKKKGATSTDTSQTYFTNNGEGRGEIEIPVPGYKMPKMITLARANARRFSLMLHPDKKTYSLNVIDTSLSGKTNYKVTRIGTETVQGYSCIHSKLVESTSGLSKTTTEVWTSTEIPGYALYKKMTAVQTSKPGMAQALENAGCGGFLVKIDVEGSSSSMIETLIKAEETHLPASLFQIPAGYTESDENMMSSFFQSAGKK